MHDKFGRQNQKAGNAERQLYEEEFQTAVAHNKALHPLLSKVCYASHTDTLRALPIYAACYNSCNSVRPGWE